MIAWNPQCKLICSEQGVLESTDTDISIYQNFPRQSTTIFKKVTLIWKIKYWLRPKIIPFRSFWQKLRLASYDSQQEQVIKMDIVQYFFKKFLEIGKNATKYTI